MKVQFIQSGGFAGLIRHCTLETDAMQPDEAATLERLVRDARLSSPTEPAAAAASARDLEEYQITIDDGDGRLSVVRDPSTLSADAKALVGYLKKCARPGLPDPGTPEAQTETKASSGKRVSKPKPR